MPHYRHMIRLGSIKRWLAVLIAACIIFSALILVYKPLTKSKISDMDQVMKLQPSTILHGYGKEQQLHQEELPTTPALNIGKPGIDFDITRAVLVFTQYENSVRLKKLKNILTSQRVSFDVITWNRLEDPFLSLPRLRNSNGLARYGGFIFDNSRIYAELDSYNKGLLHEYCITFNFGIILMVGNSGQQRETEYLKYGDTPLWIKYGVRGLYNTELNPRSSILEMTKAGQVLECGKHKGVHSVFWLNHSTYEPVSFSFRDLPSDTQDVDNIELLIKQKYPQSNSYQVNRSKFLTIVHDRGELDGVRKVFFGSAIHSLWQYQIIFLDALSSLSRGGLGRPLTRWLLVDIDDIFVAHKGIRMKRNDVQALIESQQRLAAKIPNFHYNLGFSGHFYKHGSTEENLGDKMLIENADKFWWFPHMYDHLKPHTFSKYKQLVDDMRKNKAFAKLHNLPLSYNYSVAPHHSGVYPVHEDLYRAWKEVWGVKVTSTEEYPHLHPGWLRRGFTYKDIMVLPRQTCGLFTHTLTWNEYPKGRSRLEKSIHGGELFMTLVNNPISIIMTHFGNYGSDRLAPYTFETVVDFIQKWTNLKLVTERPAELANKYFEIFPADTEPIWQNPCNDPRHLNIWSANKTCSRFPKFMIIGPQKTGTTALRAFLSLNPKLLGNHFTKRSFEEVQFFNNNNYLNGLDWYIENFPEIDNSTESYLFEKSANYFDSSKAYRRAFSLLPEAKLIVIAVNPIQRAYSWYQHVMSKHKPYIERIPFYDVITGKNTSDTMATFRRRCLLPGLYALHLEKWLSLYPAKQILVLDGDQLRYDPATALDNVEKFLDIGHFDYKKNIVFSSEKGFFCRRSKKIPVHCLGIGKGRKYPKIDMRSQSYLQDYYRLSNLRFAQLLQKHKWTQPKWLKKEIESIR